MLWMPVQVVSSLPSQLANGFDVDEEEWEAWSCYFGDVLFHGQLFVHVNIQVTHYGWWHDGFWSNTHLAIVTFHFGNVHTGSKRDRFSLVHNAFISMRSHVVRMVPWGLTILHQLYLTVSVANLYLVTDVVVAHSQSIHTLVIARLCELRLPHTSSRPLFTNCYTLHRPWKDCSLCQAHECHVWELNPGRWRQRRVCFHVAPASYD